MLQHKKVGPMVEKCYFDEILMTFFYKKNSGREDKYKRSRGNDQT